MCGEFGRDRDEGGDRGDFGDRMMKKKDRNGRKIRFNHYDEFSD